MVKFTREWAHVPNPLGYDPYDNVDGSYMVNLEALEMSRFKAEVVVNQATSNDAAAEIATAGIKPFVAYSPLGDPL